MGVRLSNMVCGSTVGIVVFTSAFKFWGDYMNVWYGAFCLALCGGMSSVVATNEEVIFRVPSFEEEIQCRSTGHDPSGCDCTALCFTTALSFDVLRPWELFDIMEDVDQLSRVVRGYYCKALCGLSDYVVKHPAFVDCARRGERLVRTALPKELYTLRYALWYCYIAERAAFLLSKDPKEAGDKAVVIAEFQSYKDKIEPIELPSCLLEGGITMLTNMLNRTLVIVGCQALTVDMVRALFDTRDVQVK